MLCHADRFHPQLEHGGPKTNIIDATVFPFVMSIAIKDERWRYSYGRNLKATD